MPEARHAYHAFERQSAILSPSTGEKPQEREKKRERGKSKLVEAGNKLEVFYSLCSIDRSKLSDARFIHRGSSRSKKKKEKKERTGTTIA